MQFIRPFFIFSILFLLLFGSSPELYADDEDDEENKIYLGVGYMFDASDKRSDFENISDNRDFSSMKLPFALEAAYYLNFGKFALGPIVSSRLTFARYEYLVGVQGNDIEIQGGVFSSHLLVGGSATFYLFGDTGDGLYGKADFGLGFADYIALDPENLQNLSPDAQPTDLTKDYSGSGFAFSLAAGYTTEFGIDLQLIYSSFPIPIEDETSLNDNTITDGADFLGLMIGLKI
ncbi:MAG: hypothetical protein Kapaf2KO_03000 [Candidatus Kapaibacteriales bacterium]